MRVVHPLPRSAAPNRSSSSLPSAPVLHELRVEHHEILAQDNAVVSVVVAVVPVDLAEEFRRIVPVPLPAVKPDNPTRPTAPTRADSDVGDPLLAPVSPSPGTLLLVARSPQPPFTFTARKGNVKEKEITHTHKNLEGTSNVGAHRSTISGVSV